MQYRKDAENAVKFDYPLAPVRDKIELFDRNA